jgi:hypothetical protein
MPTYVYYNIYMIIDALFNPTPCFPPNRVYLLGEPTSLLVVANTHPPLSLVCQQLPHPLLALPPFRTPQFRLHYLHRRHQQLKSSSSGTRGAIRNKFVGPNNLLRIIFSSPLFQVIFRLGHRLCGPTMAGTATTILVVLLVILDIYNFLWCPIYIYKLDFLSPLPYPQVRKPEQS